MLAPLTWLFAPTGLSDLVDGTAGLADGIGLVEAIFEAGDAPVAAVDDGGGAEAEFMSP